MKKNTEFKTIIFWFYLKAGPDDFMDPVLEGWRSLAAFTDEHNWGCLLIAMLSSKLFIRIF